jgi:hypothetical protein
MRVFSIEFHQAAGPGIVGIRGSEEGAVARAIDGEFEPEALAALLPSELSLVSTEGTQFRGTFYDVNETDEGRIAALFATLFPDAGGTLAGPDIVKAPSTGPDSFRPIAEYVASGQPGDFLWIRTAQSARRLTSLTAWVPEESAPGAGAWSLRFRRLTVLVISRAVLVFFHALPDDDGVETPCLMTMGLKAPRAASLRYRTPVFEWTG